MIIQHNIMAMGAYRSYMKNTNSLSKNLEKLSSGYRINRAGDDAAGLAISEKMRAQITGLDAAQKNVQDGISLVQTAEGALQEVQDTLNRMVYLATQSANGTYDNEVDRANLQKEVDALCAEIDRIADSSNFNGINLLDGSLGMNTEAIDVTMKGAVEAHDGTIDLSGLLGTEEEGTLHVEGLPKTQVDPSFTVDLTGLSVRNSGYGTDEKAEITIKLGNTPLTFEISGENTDTAAEAVTDAMADTGFLTEQVDAANDAIKISGAEGDYVFKVEKSGTEALAFTFAGLSDGAGGVDGTELTEKQVEEINALLGAPITIDYAPAAGAAGTGAISRQPDQHAATDVVQAELAADSAYAGVALTITADMVADGAKLTIDGNEFTITYDATADASAAGNNIINLSAYEEGSEEAIHAAVDMLSQKNPFTGSDATRTFKIGSLGDDSIHIDQRSDSAAGKELTDAKDVLALVTAKGTPTEAANATTTITLDAENLVEGNTITIDGTKYVFTEDAEAEAPAGTVYVDINNAVADLAEKLGDNTEYDVTVDEEAGTVTLEATDANAETSPVVLGKGLSLQIGDTSDSYNQLTVSVEDMHVDALGLADISIDTQENASDAIDRIKAAINSVSMTRGTLGATQNRLEHTANNLAVMEENIQDAESSIRDTDMAEEMMAYTKNNILIQSAQAMLAQANTVPQGVLQLLG